MKGEFALVVIGSITVKGLLGKDGNYYVPVSNVATLFQLPQNNAARDLKAILGEGSNFAKIALTEDGNNRSENTCIALAAFERLLRRLDKGGNPTAVLLSDLLVGLSLTQLFNDAFGVKFEKEERQNWLELRAKSKVTRRSLTDAAKDWYVMQYGVEPAGPYYSDLTDRMYLMLFGKRAAVLRKEYPGKGLLRDHLPKDMLHKVEATETVLVNKIDRGRNPHTAIQDLA